MMLNGRAGSPRARGQALVLVVFSMVALLAVVALIVDGGNAFAQQRVAQNGADAASEAGAVVLMQRLVGVPAKDDAAVNTAVQAVAAAGQLATPVLACYTDLSGQPLDSSGNQVGDCTGAAQVGGGTIPLCAACPGKSASGVRVYGSRSFGTFFAGIVGLGTFTASTTATAISGYVNAMPGDVIPVTFPLFATGCDGSGNAQPLVPQEDWPITSSHPLAIPLCKNGPGNVGWIDWIPPDGGAHELSGAILNSTNPPVTTPKWYHISATGSISSSEVQTAMEFWYNKIVFLPIFNATCSLPNPNDHPLNWSESNPIGAMSDCVDGGGTLNTGTGTNQWYFLVGFAAFHLDLAFINGGDDGACASFESLYEWAVPAGNADSCLIGYFVGPDYAVSQGASVGAGGGASGSNSLPGVQLIR
jgi:Flp pilus assembly protein TadG